MGFGETGLHKAPTEEAVARKRQIPIQCPECSSDRIWKDGIRYVREKEVQRYVCRSCGLRFSESTAQLQIKVDVAGEVPESFKSSQNNAESTVLCVDTSFKKASDDSLFSFCENVGSHDDSLASRVEKTLNSLRFYNRKCQVRVTETQGAKNLAEVESRTEKQAAGATKLSKENLRGKVVEYSFWLKKQGYAKSTILSRVKLIKQMIKRGANLNDPESVKETIAKQGTWSEGRKELAVECYSNYLIFVGGTWQPPRYKRVSKLPFIPTETELDQLIAGCGQKTGTFLQLLKETGARCGEAWNIDWIDIDTANNTIRLKPEKHSNPRILKISRRLIERLVELPKKSKKVFGGTQLRTMRRTFQYSRKKIAGLTKNPRILRITFHTFRHWKATMEYHKTKDILHVMKMLGHKNIKNTLVYTQLINFNEEEYISKVAWTLEEACKLVEAGFEYVCSFENGKIFRKTK